MPVVESTFLTSGPPLRLRIPDGLSVAASATAPVSVPQGGGRGLNFVPTGSPVPDYLAEVDHYLLEPRTSPQGFLVRVVERRSPPLQWYVLWSLPSGTLYSHVREEDGYSFVQDLLDNLHIVESDVGVMVLPGRPLSRGASRRPGYQERLLFTDDAPGGAGRLVELLRPAPMGRGVVERVAEERLRCRTEVGVEIRTIGCTESAVRDLRQDVEASVRG